MGRGRSPLEDWKVERNRQKKEYRASDGNGDGDGDDTDRFAARYYAGTFDEELNKLAVDTTTLWQGYYPSLYNPHTQSAAEHLPAPTQRRIDAAGNYIEEPAPEPPPPPAQALQEMKYGRGEVRRRRENPPHLGYPEGYPKTSSGLAAAGVENANAAIGAPAPVVNPLGELIPWQYANWVISMGQWRGT